ncbi:EAL and modified HD-GYP domain-containing signal transduction protein [Nitrosomonas sp. Nm84]|uniref:EAL and HDOD domain-containing protein n=1 Tax=Nitrosomonas sp. Nm84 TaxID=200124 RepID=UPI000D75A70D|nr:HDOD domain-containing protein [Nitrosomonas sp. Nm84]PXW87309.1 EAL and modified HD-GYP domain-containing signal transduction protein [Nitrosomonas sp. Nm84]
MGGFFLGRQPILDRNHNLVAFELLFRQEETEEVAHVTNDLSASANVIVNAYGQLGIQNVLGRQRGFVNADPDLIMSDIISLLPCKHVILEIKESPSITAEFMQRCNELKQKGYQFALDNVVAMNSKIEQLLPIVSVVKVDILALEKDQLAELVSELNRWPVLLLALKVENREQEARCMQLGFQMFQGYYFAKPEVLSVKRADPGKMSLLKLLTLVMSDSEIEEIEKEFKHQPGLSYNLMRMVNSVASGLPQKINSIKHAIMILGRKQLQRWVQLLLYSANQSDDGMSNALMQTAAVRGKLMELIATAERPHDKNHHERAFMVGILSLLDALLGIEMQQIVDKLGIPDDMSQALLTRDGRLGLELKLIEANEKGEITTIQSILSQLGFLSLSELADIEIQAIGWANRIGEVTN